VDAIRSARYYAGGDIAARCPYHQIGTPPNDSERLLGREPHLHFPEKSNERWKRLLSIQVLSVWVFVLDDRTTLLPNLNRNRRIYANLGFPILHRPDAIFQNSVGELLALEVFRRLRTILATSFAASASLT
jgi:hypothetical protein